MNPCPGPERLRALLADQLSASEAEAVETHLEGCPSCQQTLERALADAGTGQGTPDWVKAGGACLRRLREEPPTGSWPIPATAPPPTDASAQRTVAPFGGRGPPTTSEVEGLLR